MRDLIQRRGFLRFGLTLSTAGRLKAAGNVWNRIRYAGGTVPAKVNPYDWNTRLTISSGAIELVFSGRDTLRVTPEAVTAMAYGQKADRRVADMVALSLVVTPLALFGILRKRREHSVSIEFKDKDGKPGAVLLEIEKDSYRAVILALTTVTGKKVENAP